MNNEKILIGKKGNNMFSGYIFYPYIKISEMVLPIKMVSWNNGNPIFTKQASFMNNEKYNQIIDEAYENYSKEYEKDNSVGLTMLVQRVDGKSMHRKPNIEMFVTMCKHDKTFSEKWGLKIEERELSVKERLFFVNKSNEEYEKALANKTQYESIGLDFELALTSRMNELNIPTKLIAITYNNQTIEVYE